MTGYVMTGKARDFPGAADLLFCDALTYPMLRARRGAIVSVYRLLADECLDRIDSLFHR